MEVRTGLMKVVYVLLLNAMGELEHAMESAINENSNN